MKRESIASETKKASRTASVKTVNKEDKAVVPKKATEKKEVTKLKQPARTSVKKKEPVSRIQIQFGGRSYDNEELVKIAKDVWKYDLKGKTEDLVSVELYVKPEECAVYYVMNKDITGVFYI